MILKKFDSGTALAKIKVLISDYYERRGKAEFYDSNGNSDVLIEDIDDIIINTEIDMKKVIIERMELDGLDKEEDNENHYF